MSSVSVIICTYNPDIMKLKQTIFSTIRQIDCDFDIIISDDGSSVGFKNEVEDFFKKYKYENYRFVFHKSNVGIVNNVYDGVSLSGSTYVYLISPGDFFYSKTSLRDVYNFAQNNMVDFVFGSAKYYSINDNDEILFQNFKNPMLPNIYNFSKKCYYFTKIAFFYGQNQLGASFLRKRATFLRYLLLIKSDIKYLEDFSTSALYLLDNNVFRYFDNDIVWYEYGVGVSTSNNKYWNDLLRKDCLHLGNLLLRKYSKSRILKAKYKSKKYLDILIVVYVVKVFAKIKKFLKKRARVNEEELRNILSLNNDVM